MLTLIKMREAHQAEMSRKNNGDEMVEVMTVGM